jgi:hypothetical protein
MVGFIACMHLVASMMNTNEVELECRVWFGLAEEEAKHILQGILLKKGSGFLACQAKLYPFSVD